MCLDGLFGSPKQPDLPTPPPLPEANPQAFNTQQNQAAFGLQAFRRRAAAAGRQQTIRTSPLGLTGQSTTAGKRLLGA